MGKKKYSSLTEEEKATVDSFITKISTSSTHRPSRPHAVPESIQRLERGEEVDWQKVTQVEERLRELTENSAGFPTFYIYFLLDSFLAEELGNSFKYGQPPTPEQISLFRKALEYIGRGCGARAFFHELKKILVS